MSAIDNLRARFSAQEVRSKTFFEDADPLEVFCTPLTVFESDKIQKAAKGSDFLYCVELVYLKAQNAEGERLFPTMKEKQLLLKNVRAEDVAQIAGWIASNDEADEKN